MEIERHFLFKLLTKWNQVKSSFVCADSIFRSTIKFLGLKWHKSRSFLCHWLQNEGKIYQHHHTRAFSGNESECNCLRFRMVEYSIRNLLESGYYQHVGKNFNFITKQLIRISLNVFDSWKFQSCYHINISNNNILRN